MLKFLKSLQPGVIGQEEMLNKLRTQKLLPKGQLEPFLQQHPDLVEVLHDNNGGLRFRKRTSAGPRNTDVQSLESASTAPSSQEYLEMFNLYHFHSLPWSQHQYPWFPSSPFEMGPDVLLRAHYMIAHPLVKAWLHEYEKWWHMASRSWSNGVICSAKTNDYSNGNYTARSTRQ